MKKFYLLFFCFFVFITGCKSFITDEQIEGLKRYEPGTYKLKEDVYLNGIKRMDKGTEVKIYLVGTEDFVKVYAYPANQSFLKSRRSLIIYVFEDDFENKKYEDSQFEHKLAGIVEKIN